MKKNKIITAVYYLSLLVLLGVIFSSFVLTITNKYVISGTFIDYFISNIISLGGYTGFYFAPIAITVSVISRFFNTEKTKYFIIILFINILFIISTYFFSQAVSNSIRMI